MGISDQSEEDSDSSQLVDALERIAAAMENIAARLEEYGFNHPSGGKSISVVVSDTVETRSAD